MTFDEFKAAVHRGIAVDAQMVAISRKICLGAATGRQPTSALVDSVLKSHGLTRLERVVIGPSSQEALIESMIGYYSWSRAAAEAIWGLIHANVLLPAESVQADHRSSVGYTFNTGNSSQSGEWTDFDRYNIALPRTVERAPSLTDSNQLALANSDLYLDRLGIDGMGDEITEALREAVTCFRHELFGAAAALLGKASEGAWIELGTALMGAVPLDQAGSVAAQRKTLDDAFASLQSKVAATCLLYERDLFADVVKRSGVKPKMLREAQQWTEVVRDSRNAIHFGVAAAFENNYEKISILLLAAAQPLRYLYAIRSAAIAVAAER